MMMMRFPQFPSKKKETCFERILIHVFVLSIPGHGPTVRNGNTSTEASLTLRWQESMLSCTFKINN